MKLHLLTDSESVLSPVVRLLNRFTVEPFLPVAFSLVGILLLKSGVVPDWQWMFLTMLACMSLIGMRDPMRSELVAWRFLTLTFAVIVFLVLDAGLHSGFMLWVYVLAVVYPWHITQISLVAITTAIATGFALAEFWVIGLTLSLLHVPGVFIVGKVSSFLAQRINEHGGLDPGSIPVLRIRTDQSDDVAVTSSILNLWRDSVADFLGEDVVILTTANRELAVLLPDRTRAQTESVAQTLRYRFSALALPPVIIALDAISSQAPATTASTPLRSVAS